MNARRRLNVAYVNGSLLIAGVAALATGGNLAVFGGVLAVCLAGSLYCGEIRASPQGRKRK